MFGSPRNEMAVRLRPFYTAGHTHCGELRASEQLDLVVKPAVDFHLGRRYARLASSVDKGSEGEL